jgi:hypothetical protein
VGSALGIKELVFRVLPVGSKIKKFKKKGGDQIMFIFYMVTGIILFIGGLFTVTMEMGKPSVNRFTFWCELGFLGGIFLGNLIAVPLLHRTILDVGFSFLLILSYLAGIEVRRRLLEKACRRYSR